MASLPTLSGRAVVNALLKDGWQIARQRGSHVILVKAGHMATLSVPDHREIAKGTRDDRANSPSTDKMRMVRGGSWEFVGLFCRSAERNMMYPPQFKCCNIGFRVVLAPGS
jgi:predicted RNA binding protein YcfA (HicA-like mRNA interferase family)